MTALVWYLRFSLALIYIWFGILKPMGFSEAQPLVLQTLSWSPLPGTMHWLGWWEVLIGVLWLVPRFTRFVFWMTMVHMVGTFLPFVIAPATSYRDSVAMLTLVGQYIVKNFALVGCAVGVKRLSV
jgi:uncharacterized membrane protein YphA (DoxX/SURF4 family)